jgi:hypothetical protein
VSLHVIVLLPTVWAIGLSQRVDQPQGLRSTGSCQRGIGCHGRAPPMPELVPSPPHPSHAHPRRPYHPRHAFLHFLPSHGHSQSVDLRPLLLRVRASTSGKDGVVGPHWVRIESVTWGSRRARAVTTSTKEPQVIASARPGPRPPEHGGSGFESHLTAAAGQRPLPTRQASPRTGLTLPRSWCHCRQARAMFALTGRAPTCPKHRSTAVIQGQQGSVRVPSELWITPYGAIRGSFQARGLRLPRPFGLPTSRWSPRTGLTLRTR